LVSNASLAESLIAPPSACLSSVHITHAHSAQTVAVTVSTWNATSSSPMRASRIITRPPGGIRILADLGAAEEHRPRNAKEEAEPGAPPRESPADVSEM